MQVVDEGGLEVALASFEEHRLLAEALKAAGRPARGRRLDEPGRRAGRIALTLALFALPIAWVSLVAAPDTEGDAHPLDVDVPPSVQLGDVPPFPTTTTSVPPSPSIRLPHE